MSAKKAQKDQYIDDQAAVIAESGGTPVRRRRGSMIALERRKKILSILSQRRKVTYAELVNECGVSQRTIQTDIEELILLYPIETIRGHGGGIRMMADYYPDSIKMTAEQTALCRRLAKQLTGHDLEVMISILSQFGERKF